MGLLLYFILALSVQAEELTSDDMTMQMNYSAKGVVFYRAKSKSCLAGQRSCSPLFTNIKSVIFQHDQNRNINVVGEIKNTEEEDKTQVQAQQKPQATEPEASNFPERAPSLTGEGETPYKTTN